MVTLVKRTPGDKGISAHNLRPLGGAKNDAKQLVSVHKNEEKYQKNRARKKKKSLDHALT